MPPTLTGLRPEEQRGFHLARGLRAAGWFGRPAGGARKKCHPLGLAWYGLARKSLELL